MSEDSETLCHIVDLGCFQHKIGVGASEDDEGDRPDALVPTDPAGYSRGRLIDSEVVWQQLAPRIERDSGRGAVCLGYGLPSATDLESMYTMLFEVGKREQVVLGSQGNFAGIATGRESFAVVDVGFGLTQVSCYWMNWNLQNSLKGSSRYLQFGSGDLPEGKGRSAEGLVLPDGAAVLAHTAIDLLAQALGPAQKLKGIVNNATMEAYTEKGYPAPFSELLNNIVLVGGAAREPSLIAQARLALPFHYPGRHDLPEEVELGAGDDTFQVHARDEDEATVDAAWLGMSITSALSNTSWVSKAEFAEHGSSRLGREMTGTDWFSGTEEPVMYREALNTDEEGPGRPLGVHIDKQIVMDESFPRPEFWANCQTLEET